MLEHPDFVEERDALPEEVQDKHDAVIPVLEQYGVCSGWGQNDTIRPDVIGFSTCIRR